jgi:hypothetical protein
LLVDAPRLYELGNILLTNKILVNIDLGHNEFGVAGALRLSTVLKTNCTLEYLNLEWNNIRTEGFCAIISSLKENKFTFIYFFIFYFFFGTEKII